jgi:hypothetical protein
MGLARKVSCTWVGNEKVRDYARTEARISIGGRGSCAGAEHLLSTYTDCDGNFFGGRTLTVSQPLGHGTFGKCVRFY